MSFFAVFPTLGNLANSEFLSPSLVQIHHQLFYVKYVSLDQEGNFAGQKHIQTAVLVESVEIGERWIVVKKEVRGWRSDKAIRTIMCRENVRP